MTNGTIPPEGKAAVLKEVFALLLIMFGLAMFLLGVGVVWGKGGLCIVGGSVFVYLGYRLGISKTGKE